MSPLSIFITIVVVIIIFLIIRYIIIDPYTLQNMQDATTYSKIDASTLATNTSGTPASNFAYSIWFFINDWSYRYGQPKVIFGRMGSASTPITGTSIPGVSGVDPCPAVVLGAVENNVAISLGCYPGADQEPTTTGGKTIIHTCSVANIPIQRWVNLVISVYGRTMDIYIDGKLTRTCLLPGVAAVNNNANVFVTPKGGFSGYTSNFQYFPNSINPQEAWNIYVKGYGGSLFSNMNYQVQISLVENGVTQSTVTV